MMEKCLIMCFVLLSLLCKCVSEFLICRNTADDLALGASSQSCKETTDRIKTLEEQVRQLRRIIDNGGHIDRRTRYQDIPAGEIKCKTQMCLLIDFY